MPENNDAADSRFGQSPPVGDDSLRLDEDCPVAGAKRRTVLKATLGAGLSLGLGAAPLTELAAATAKPPEKMRPQKGDRLVYLSGDKKDQIAKLDDLTPGGPQLLAYPIDPASQVVRNGSGLNMVLVIRLDPAEMTEETRANSAEGVVAYSASCSHQACPVSMWKEDAKTLYCSCHGSQFDPADRAKVVGGPAPRRLAMLPLTIENGELVVAAEFIGRVGMKRK